MNNVNPCAFCLLPFLTFPNFTLNWRATTKVLNVWDFLTRLLLTLTNFFLSLVFNTSRKLKAQVLHTWRHQVYKPITNSTELCNMYIHVEWNFQLLPYRYALTLFLWWFEVLFIYIFWYINMNYRSDPRDSGHAGIPSRHRYGRLCAENSRAIEQCQRTLIQQLQDQNR